MLYLVSSDERKKQFMTTKEVKLLDMSKIVWVVDFNHLVHKYFQGMRANGVTLTAEVTVEREDSRGSIYQETVIVDTTVLSSMLKFFANRLSGGGYNPMVICADSKIWSRKEYIKTLLKNEGKAGTYKSGRPRLAPDWWNSAETCLNLFRGVGVCVLQKDNYEADDLIAEAVRVAKEQYPNNPICVLTGDLDMVPLVDEQVSIYMYPATQTYAEDGFPELHNYEQITPNSYQRILERKTSVKKLSGFAPYNSLLATKIIRGDSSDTIPCMSGFFRKPKRLVDLLIELMEKEGVDIFRYEPSGVFYEYKPTGERFPLLPYKRQLTKYEPSTLANVPFSVSSLPPLFNLRDWFVKVEEPTEKVEHMRQLLEKYGLTEEEGCQFVERYRAMNLNGAFLEMENPKHRRKPYRILEPLEYGADYIIPPLDLSLLRTQALKFQIHI